MKMRIKLINSKTTMEESLRYQRCLTTMMVLMYVTI
jgi:hypothetical protein